MGILSDVRSTIASWLKKTFGKKASAKNPPKASDYRRATKDEVAHLVKSGVISGKSPVFVKTSVKRVTKKTKIYSNRAIRRLKAGGATPEQQAKARKPVEKSYPEKDGKVVRRYTYAMPVEREAFNRRLKQIQKAHPGEKVKAAAVVQYDGPKAEKGQLRVRYLKEFSYDEEIGSPVANKYSGNALSLTAAWLVVTIPAV